MQNNIEYGSQQLQIINETATNKIKFREK